MKSTDYIIKYINYNTTEAINGRGMGLYENGAILEANYEEDTDIWDFEVLGTREYQVRISGVKSKKIKTNCSCPFEWNSFICKHRVAALLYINDNSVVESEQADESVQEAVPILTRDIYGYELKNYQLINDDYLRNNVPQVFLRKIVSEIYRLDVESIDIKNNELAFRMTQYYFSIEVLIRHINGKVFIQSSENSQANELSNMEVAALVLIAKSQTPNILGILFGEDLDEKKKKVLGFYGFKKNLKFERHFNMVFDFREGLMITPKESGLISVSGKSELPFNFIKEHSLEEQIKMMEIIDLKEERELGFVFLEDYYDDAKDFSIIPIIGKPSKDKGTLNSHIKKYDEYLEYNFNIKKSKNTRELMSMVYDINDEDYNDDDLGFSNFRKTLSLLAHEKNVYLSLTNDYRIKKKDLIPVTVSEKPINVGFKVHQSKKYLEASLMLYLEGIDEEIDTEEFLENKSMMVIIDNVIYPIKDDFAWEVIMEYEGEMKMLKGHRDVFYEKVVKPLSKNFKVDFQEDIFNYEEVRLDFNKKQVFLSEMEEHLIIKPQVIYGEETAVALFSTGNIIQKDKDKVVEFVRNYDMEDQFLDLIAELHPDFEMQKKRKFFHLHYNDFTKNLWFYKFFDFMQANEVEVFGLKNLKKFKYSPHKGTLSTSIASGEDWFEVGVDINFGKYNVSLKDIRKAVINQQKYVELKDGSVGLLPEEWLKKLSKYFRNGTIKEDKLEISKLRFSIIDELFDEIDDEVVLKEITEKRRRLKAFSEISKVAVPKQITADLRDYQKEGLNWLNFLDEMGWGGILADDMGLGKTLQILSFIQHISKTNKLPNLIVVPTTLLFNWQNEIQKFAPKIKAFYHYGVTRLRETEHFNDYNIIFTTYGTLLRDIEFLKEFNFHYMVLDESQAIKNPASRRYKASVLIKAKNKFTLTGTPIENGTFDLYAQMNFVNPGFFGSIKSFKENYSNPIDKEGDELRAGELQRIVNPFILRRTKERVATELPPKTEDVIYCEMEADQRRVYDAYRNSYRDQLMDKIADEGLGKSKLMVLEALTRLRQICDSPALLKDDDIAVNQSIKIKEIVRHITNKTANHKVLIFSQFVSMLSLIRDELHKLNIPHEYLDGQRSSKQREASVNNFQQNNKLRVFLISLKAGGLGLNLTSADYVYIIDPWWNPAVENQAIDRCYRIGQDKHVFAYRMICKNTVEEKIMHLQAKKKKIAGDIIQTDENIMKTINKKDIAELFS